MRNFTRKTILISYRNKAKNFLAFLISQILMKNHEAADLIFIVRTKTWWKKQKIPNKSLKNAFRSRLTAGILTRFQLGKTSLTALSTRSFADRTFFAPSPPTKTGEELTGS